MSDQIGVRATFMRGGTSKGLYFRWEDVPEARDAFLCAAIGAGDAYGRQLDGMGGGVSSLSKAMLVRRSDRAGVDVDYLFAQAAIREPVIDYSANCGNLSSGVGCFAVDQGLVSAEQSWISVFPGFGATPTPARGVAPETLRDVLAAIREPAALQVTYQSMSRPEPNARWIEPHALAFDGCAGTAG